MENYEPKTVDGKFMESMHKKVDTPKKDEPKVETQTMKYGNILDTIRSFH